MSDYHYLVHDASTGLALAELPLQSPSFSRVLTGCGTLTASLPLRHPLVTKTILGQNRSSPDREVTVFRGDDAVWNGPLTGTDADVEADTLELTAREVTWYFGKRTIEEDMEWAVEDRLTIVRDVLEYGLFAKQSQGGDGMTAGDNIIAVLPRWGVDLLASGDVIAASFAGSARHTLAEAMEFLAADPETGFDYRVDYFTGSTRQSVARTLMFDPPDPIKGFSLVRTQVLTENVLLAYGHVSDWERAATRVHVLGAGFTKTLQSTSAVTDGVLLSEVVEDYSDAADHDQITARAKDLRRLSRPPVRAYSVSFIPSAALPYGWCDLGDTVTLAIAWPEVQAVSDTRRVMQIDVTPQDGSEVVELTLNDPLTELND